MSSNEMTRDEWLNVILNSGEVTRISQHLALVIYHLTDPATNKAKMSARDLERITGWGRTAIIDHVNELDIFIRVRWGMGRAKAQFELQGVITEAVKPLQIARQAESNVSAPDSYVRLADTNADTRTPFITYVRHADTTVDATVDTNSCVHEADTRTDTNSLNTVLVSTTRTQRGGKGGSLDSLSFSTPTNARAHVRETDEEPPAFFVHPDGSFSGTAFEHFTATEMASLKTIYVWLEFPAQLVAADQVLAVDFEKDGTPFGSQERLKRLHQYLNRQNQRAAGEVRAAQDNMRSKKTYEDESCWFSEDRLMVANGFKSELLELVGGSEQRLRITLDKAAASVPIDLKGPALRKVVRGQFTRHADWHSQDERKVVAVEKRLGPGDPATTESREQKWARMRAEKHAKGGN